MDLLTSELHLDCIACAADITLWCKKLYSELSADVLNIFLKFSLQGLKRQLCFYKTMWQKYIRVVLF